MNRNFFIPVIILLFCSFLNINRLAGQNSCQPVWKIGEHDQSGKEFDYFQSDYKDFRVKYKKGIILYEVGKSKTTDIPYVLPGTSDSWAGSPKGQLMVRFGIDEIEEAPAKLRINLLETHPSSPPVLQIEVNDYQITVNTPRGNNQNYLDNKKTTSKNLFVEVDIPAGKLRKGDNIVVIRNSAGSWIAMDNIVLSSCKNVKLGKTSDKLSMLNAEVIPALMYDNNNTLAHPVHLHIVNWDKQNQSAKVNLEGLPTKNINLKPGINTIELTAPETNIEKKLKLEVLSGKNTIGQSVINIKPVKKWTVYLVQHSHTDIGYTKPQTEILTEHLRYIDYAIEYCELTENYPDDAKFRWTCEASWAVREYLENRPKEQIEKLKKYINNGQIEVTAMFFNMAEIIDENAFKTFLAPIKEFKKQGIPVKLAMQNDVNGIAWCLADYFPDLDVKYVWMGEHGHRALIPFDKPTVFKWESPSGKSVLAFRADHYNTGNFWGIEHGDIDMITPKLFSHLQSLENRNYPFDAVGVQYSGYFTDNSPPSMVESDLIREWNKKYAYPKLRSALPSEFMDYVATKYGNQLETQRVAYPDWWTDGFGSAARETGASRKTHSDMITIEGMLSMAKIKGKSLPAHVPDGIRHIHESLLFYDEHTFGASESVVDPMCENSQVQWAEKSSFAWEGLKSAQMMYEASIGLVQNDLYRTKNPTITFFNTLNWKRSELITSYIDFEVIPRDVAFRIVDEKGKSLKVQPLQSRREGRYYAIYAEDIPAMGYKTYEIIIDNKKSERLQDTQLTKNVIENNYYRIKFDPVKGAVESLYDKQLQKEMVDGDSPWQLGAFIYEKLDNRRQMERYMFTDYERHGMTNCTVKAGTNGPIYQSINIEGKSKGCDEDFGIKIELRLFHNTKKIELAYAIKRLPEVDPTGIYVAFPFKLDNAKLVFDVQGGTVTSGENQLTGTASDWNTVQNFVSARNNNAQFIVGSDIVPLYQLGRLLDGPFQYKKSYDKPHVFSWVMNNYWVTNFRAFQEGEFKWSYYLTSTDDLTNAVANKFAWSSRVPLYARVMPVGKDNGKPREYSAFNIDKNNLLMTSCTPSSIDGSVLLNVRELDGKATELRIHDAKGKQLSFDVVNAIDEVISSNHTQITFKPFENKFIRLKY